MSIHVPPPSGAQSSPLAAFADLSAAPVPSEGLAALRACLSAHIERCLAILDAIDDDPDLEETGDAEPWLAGAPFGLDLDAEEDAIDHGVADHGGLYEQGFIPGRGLELLWEEAEASRDAAAKLGAIIARLAGGAA